MLVIRDEQIAAFRAHKLKRFEDAMVKHIAAGFPEKYQKWGEPKTRDFIRRGVETGHQNGITGGGPLVGLIELMFQFGARFELCPERAWALDLLAHKTLPGDAKVQMIAERFQELSGGRTIEEVGEEDE
jgi:hypothetical protein